MATQSTAIVTGASQGIGAEVVRAFLRKGYNVVANSRNISNSGAFSASERLALVDGDIGEPATAREIVDMAVTRFGSIDVLVNNAGIFFAKHFIDYTTVDFEQLSAVNVKGFLYVTQGSVRQMLKQNRGGSVISITASQVVNPIASILGSVPMITKGGIEAVTRSLASEYAPQHVRFNAVSLGIVDTPMHAGTPKDELRALSPMNTISSVGDVADAVMYLTGAVTVTGEILHVDGGAHQGKW